MTSYVNTTAVSIRKGSTEANNGFTGVLGEVTADLGMPDDKGRVYGTDLHTTLRLHNGIDAGGIRMARADTRNLTTEVLAENRETFGDKNLAYATLSNLEELSPSTQSRTINNIVDIFMNYGLANKDCRNIDTSDLATIGHGHSGENLAYANMSNVNTVNLASSTGHAGKNLAYADTGNINTANLVDTSIHTGDSSTGKPLAYADASNINTDNLATDRGSAYGSPLLKADLTNAAENAFDNLFDNVYKVESTINKDDVIPDLPISGHYPETAAVKDYVNNKISGSNYLYRDLTNATSWDVLYNNNQNSIYTYSATIIDSDAHITLPALFPTSIVLPDDSLNLTVIVTSFNGNNTGVIGTAKFAYPFGSTDLRGVTSIEIKPDEESQYTAILGLTCTKVLEETPDNPAIYYYTISNIIDGGHDFTLNTKYEVRYIEPTTFSRYITPALYIQGLQVDKDGAIVAIQVNPSTGSSEVTSQQLTLSDLNGKRLQVNLDVDKPFANGAGLVKLDLTNLLGMNNEDREAEENSEWCIRHDKNIPLLDKNRYESYDDASYYQIVTAGLVHDALINMLDIAWPVGSAYEGIQDICPLQSLIPGSQWELLEEEINLIKNESGSNFYLNKWLRVK